MKWLNTLFALSELPPEAFEELVRQRILRFSLESLRCKKGTVRFARNHDDVVTEIIVILSRSLPRAEREVTLIHELFHLLLGAIHPDGDMMMSTMSKKTYAFVEKELDVQAYAFCEKHPDFVAALYDRFYAHLE